MLDLAVMMNCVGRDLDLVAIGGIWPRSPVGIFSLREYNIASPKDLEGERVALDPAGRALRASCSKALVPLQRNALARSLAPTR